MEEKIKALKDKLENIGTRDLLGMIGIHFITFANGQKTLLNNRIYSIKQNLFRHRSNTLT